MHQERGQRVRKTGSAEFGGSSGVGLGKVPPRKGPLDQEEGTVGSRGVAQHSEVGDSGHPLFAEADLQCSSRRQAG